MNSNRIYQIFLLLAIAISPYLNFSAFLPPAIFQVKIENDKISFESVSDENFIQRFGFNSTSISENVQTDSDSIIVADGSIFWCTGTESLRERLMELCTESNFFDKIVQILINSEYPFTVKSVPLDKAVAEFSSLYGELRFDIPKMQDFLFDAALIEEFVHAYQASYYGYNHGQCRKKDRIFSMKDMENEAHFRNKMELGFLNWRRFGAKFAYIESEAKLITYLVQHQAASVPINNISATDTYNSGAAAKYFIVPHLKKRNCQKFKRTQKLNELDDYYVELEAFMAYQHAFVRHWRLKDPGSVYTRGKLRHRPEALQTLTKK
jgi:hypothetical protein